MAVVVSAVRSKSLRSERKERYWRGWHSNIPLKVYIPNDLKTAPGATVLKFCFI